MIYEIHYLVYSLADTSVHFKTFDSYESMLNYSLYKLKIGMTGLRKVDFCKNTYSTVSPLKEAKI